MAFGSKDQAGQASRYPYVNFGKFDTWVVIVHYQQESDTLHVRTSLPATEVGTVSVPPGITLRYNLQEGDLLDLEVKELEKSFLSTHQSLVESWRQIKATRPTPYRVELTPFLRQIFSHIRQLLIQVQGQDRSVFPQPVNIRMNWT